MGVPYQIGPLRFDFTAEVAGVAVLELGAPWRGVLRSLVIEQLGAGFDGTFEVFTAELAARVAAGLGGAESSSIPGGDPSLYSLTGEVEIVGGRGRLVADLPYQNSDSTTSHPVRRLWLVVRAPDIGEGGEYTFSVRGMVDQPGRVGV